MDLYWLLASNESATRLKAANDISAQMAALSSPTADSIHADQNYALVRLTKGLASGRDSARQGFALALTELIRSLPCLKTSDLLDLLLKYTDTTGSMKGQEVRDILFGRIFGIQSLIQSGCLGRDTTCTDDLERIIGLLIGCSKEKSFLEECSYWLILQVLQQPLASSVVQSTIALVFPTSEDDQNMIGMSLTQVYFLLEAQKWSILPVSQKLENPLENIKLLTEALKESMTSHPNLHCIWHSLIDIVLAKNSSLDIGKFWQIIETSMVPSTHLCKHAAFLVFDILLSKADAADLHAIFTPSFLRCFVTSLADEKTFLHKIAKKTVFPTITDLTMQAKSLDQLLKVRPELCPILAIHLPQNFDALTKSQTLAGVVKSLTPDGITAYIAHLKDSYTAHPERCCNQMGSLLRNAGIPHRDEGWMSSVLEFLGEKACNGDTTARVRYISGIDDLVRLNRTQDWIRMQAKYCMSASKAFENDISVKEMLTKILDIKSDSLGKLGCLIIIYVLNESLEFPGILEEILELSIKLEAKPVKRKRKDDDNDDTLLAHDVLVDLIVGLLSRPSKLVRETALKVFEDYCGMISAAGLDIIFGVLEAKNAEDGLFDLESDGEDDNDSSSSDDDGGEDETSDDDSDTQVDSLETSMMEEPMILVPVSNEEVNSDDGLNDEEMAVFDDKLVEIFKEKKRLLAEKKASKQQVIHFKVRVIDLLDIYIKKQSAKKLMLYMLPKLLNHTLKSAIQSSKGELEIHEKLISVALKVSKVKSTPECEASACLKTLAEVHQITRKSAFNGKLVLTCSRISLFLVRMITNAAQAPITPDPISSKKIKKSKKPVIVEQIDAVLEHTITSIYAESLQDLLSNKRTHLDIKFFIDYANRAGKESIKLLEPLCAGMTMENVSGAFQLLEGTRIFRGVVNALSKETRLEFKDCLQLRFSELSICVGKALDQIESGKRVKELQKMINALQKHLA